MERLIEQKQCLALALLDFPHIKMPKFEMLEEICEGIKNLKNSKNYCN